MIGEPIGDDDDALLARLNNLKQSSVTFGSSNSPLGTCGASEPDETPEDLISRFEKLYGRQSANSHEQAPSSSAINDDQSGPPSPTIEELLDQLGPEEQYTLSSTDLKEADDLLAEAKCMLPDGDTADQRAERRSSDGSPDRGPRGRSTDATKPEQDEEAETEASLQRLLDEVELERQQEHVSIGASSQIDRMPAHPTSSLPESFASLVFPSTPDLPLQSLALPSVPTAPPSARKPKSTPPGFSEQDIDSWCIICCANATVKCFGCDGDLYCWGCWREGHMGEDVGLEEKSHVWERAVKRKG